MIRFALILLGFGLAGCATPGPMYRGVPATRLTVEGATYDVRLRGLRAEAIRINPQYAPRFGPLRAKAAMAMEKASGCKVVDVRGDQAQAIGHLDCGDGPAPAMTRPTALECVPVR